MRHAYSRFGEPCKEFLTELSEELGLPHDKDHAFRVLRALFDIIRKHINPEQSFHLIETLPFCLKIVYVDHWTVQFHFETINSQSEFKTAFLDAYGPEAIEDFVPTDKVIIAIKDTFRVIGRHLDEVNKTEFFVALPMGAQQLWEETVMV